MTYLNIRKYKIIWFENFVKDLNKIYKYVYFHLNEHLTAKKIYKKIVTSISLLEYFPEKYQKLNNPKNYNYHRLLIYNYVIIYEVDNDIR